MAKGSIEFLQQVKFFRIVEPALPGRKCLGGFDHEPDSHFHVNKMRCACRATWHRRLSRYRHADCGRSCGNRWLQNAVQVENSVSVGRDVLCGYCKYSR